MKIKFIFSCALLAFSVWTLNANVFLPPTGALLPGGGNGGICSPGSPYSFMISYNDYNDSDCVPVYLMAHPVGDLTNYYSIEPVEFYPDGITGMVVNYDFPSCPGDGYEQITFSVTLVYKNDNQVFVPYPIGETFNGCDLFSNFPENSGTATVSFNHCCEYYDLDEPLKFREIEQESIVAGPNPIGDNDLKIYSSPEIISKIILNQKVVLFNSFEKHISINNNNFNDGLNILTFTLTNGQIITKKVIKL